MFDVRHAGAALVLPLVVSILAASCGGGSSGSSPVDDVRPPGAGKIFPPVANAVLVEYDSQGAEIQRSWPTDSTGSFMFEKPFTGQRIQAIANQPTLRSPASLSARLRLSQAMVEVTPLTTLFDQFVDVDNSPEAARQRIFDLVGNNCGANTAVAAADSLYGDDAPLSGEAHDWLLRSLGAYLASFGNVGLSASSSGVRWPALVAERSELLGHICATAQIIASQAWLDATKKTLAANLNIPGTSILLDAISTLRATALDNVLTLVGTRMVELQYPALSSRVGLEANGWLGREQEIAVQLIEAHLRSETLPTNVQASTVTPLSVRTMAEVDSSGNIVRSLTARSDPTSTLRFSNENTEERRVRIIVNDVDLADFKGILAQILAMPVSTPDEPLWQRAWRYVVARRQHTAPLTGGRFQHQPDLYLRSVGSGYCDDVASVLHWIWQGLGFDARVVALSGHVVPEVRVGGRWELYDPDFGVHYFNRNGVVASVDDIADDPDLLLNPLRPVGQMSDTVAQLLADIYSSKGDNQVDPWYSTPAPEPAEATFVIPGGGYLEFASAASQIVSTIDPVQPVGLSPVRLWIAPGYAGVIDLPMVLVDATGSGRVSLLGASFDVTPAGIAPVINDYYAGLPEVGITKIVVERVDAYGMMLTMTANPTLSRDKEQLKIKLVGADLSGLVVTALPSSTQ